jgi:hypothetical protein
MYPISKAAPFNTICFSAKKRIFTMMKSGCCWHEYSSFNVVEGKIVPLKVIEVDDTDEIKSKVEMRTFDGKNWETTIQ